MTRFIFLFVMILCLVGCVSRTQEKPTFNTEKANLSDLNVIISSAKPIDSIWFADIGQKESYFLPYKDTIRLDLKRNINDLYTINVHAGGEKIGSQIWLNGEQLVIHLKLENNKLDVIDVNTSSLYKASLKFTKTIQELVTQKQDSVVIDQFMVSQIREYLDTPLSHVFVSNYLYRNQNNRKKVDKVYRLMRMQEDSLQRHFINNNKRITNILNKEAVKFARYDLGDIDDKKKEIVLDASKHYLLDFWFLRCPPCLRDHKQMKQDYSIFKENDITLISISKDDDYALWKNYVNKNNFPWLNLREQKPEIRLTYDLSIWTYPAYVLINSSGSIIKRFNSFSHFQQYINNK